MDHVDWLDAKTVQELANTLAQQVLPGGIVIWRSASLSPPYSKVCAAWVLAGSWDLVLFVSYLIHLMYFNLIWFNSF
jgi:hypothetical protein